MPLGINTSNDVGRILIPRYSMLPVTASHNFTWPAKAQTSVVQLLEGESTISSHNQVVGEIVVDKLDEDPCVGCHLEVTVAVETWGR